MVLCVRCACLSSGGDGEGFSPTGHEGEVQCRAEGVQSGVQCVCVCVCACVRACVRVCVQIWLFARMPVLC